MNIATDPLSTPCDRSDADPDVDFVAVDVETACSRISSICQIGVVGFREGREVFAYDTLVDPCDEFPPSNTRVHGISCDHVVGKPTFARVHEVVERHLAGRIVVAHSLFDKGALAAACRIHELRAISATWLDSVRVARRAWPELPSHRLSALSRHLKIRHRHHDALSDARVAGMVLVRAIEHTGLDLVDWLRPSAPRSGPAPKAASDGLLRGHRVAVLGAARDGELARWLAAAGALVTASVGTTSTMLVISRDQPFGRFVHASVPYRRAEDLRRGGQELMIIEEEQLREQLARAMTIIPSS